MQKFVIRGTRGSMPVCGRQFLKHGGETTCFTFETNAGIVVVDSGTGISALNAVLTSITRLPPITVLFTHFHLDHIVGLPSFSAVYRSDADITFMADPARDDDWRASIRALVSGPYWPADILMSKSQKEYRDLPGRSGSMNVYGAEISWCPVFHPQRCLSYKVQTDDGSIVIATDHEHAPSDLSSGFLEFCRGADCLIYDAMYTPQEYVHKIGWGHGNWQQGVQLALEANVKELVLTHHDPNRTDEEIDRMVRTARQFFPNTRAATRNMVLRAS